MGSVEKQKKSGPDAPDLGVTQTSVPTRSGLMDLAASLIHTGAVDLEETRDEIISLPVGRPSLVDYFRIHPTLHGDVSLLKIKGTFGDELYAVAPQMISSVDNVKRYTLFFGVTREGSSFLWPISATGKDGYSRSARQIALDAMKSWCRIVPDHASSTYKKRVAQHCNEEPVWQGDKTFTELLVLAFGDGRIIDSEDHPIVKRMWLR
ncbi:hypothetical protein [Tunturiibacter lichenicola]|uniref:hypothetical protein n=1 Tax=Tunturiibacter lichenicola TaxID=2051959 RepID=UPI003D9AE945